MTGINYLKQIYKSKQVLTEKDFIRATQIENDRTRRIAYNAYCEAQISAPSEGKFNKFFAESMDIETKYI